MRFNQFARRAALALALFAAWGAQADTTPIPNPNTCSTPSVKLTGAAPSGSLANPSDPVPAFPTPINSTKCYGVMNSALNEGVEGADPNLGYLGDGLLNGEVAGNKQGITAMPPYEFLTNQFGDVPYDLQGDGSADDPGWIFLGKQNMGDSFQYGTIDGPEGEFNLSQIIKFTFGPNEQGATSGTWRLEVDKDVVQKLTDQGLFTRSRFDHLAFVLKAGDAWAVYDFNYNLLGGFDLSIPYTQEGTWTTGFDFLKNGNPQGLSHMSLWARDPITDNRVPEPGTLVLIGMGLLAAGWARQRRH